MSSKAAAYFREALASPSEVRVPAQSASEIPDLPDTIQTHLNTRHIRSRTGLLGDARRSFMELRVNLHSPAYELLVNPAPNQRNSSNISDYNVAYIVEKTL